MRVTPPACILLEPEIFDALVDTVLRDHSPRRITLDKLDSDVPGVGLPIISCWSG